MMKFSFIKYDNILHMIKNYKNCSECNMIVLTWLMDNQWVYDRLMEGLNKFNLDIKSVTLICDEPTLLNRWKNDKLCEWRTDERLQISLKSLPYFTLKNNTIDTSNLSIEEVSNLITNHE